jgi:hypothetical protein
MSTSKPHHLPSWRALPAILAVAASLCPAACGSPSGADLTAETTRLYAYPGNPLFSAAALLKANGQQAEAADV